MRSGPLVFLACLAVAAAAAPAAQAQQGWRGYIATSATHTVDTADVSVSAHGDAVFYFDGSTVSDTGPDPSSRFWVQSATWQASRTAQGRYLGTPCSPATEAVQVAGSGAGQIWITISGGRLEVGPNEEFVMRGTRSGTSACSPPFSEPHEELACGPWLSVDLAQGTDTIETAGSKPPIGCLVEGTGTTTWSLTRDPDPPECADGVDNDGDGRIDYAGGVPEAKDPGCDTASDDDEEDVGDRDDDGRADDRDTCPDVPNNGPGQQAHDDDHDGIGDACDGYECEVYPTGIDGCALMPGDILLWRSTDPSWIETEMGDTFFSHAAIVIGYYDLDAPTPSPSSDACVELEVGPLDPGCELVIADAMPQHPDGEIALRDIRWTDFGKPPDRGEEFQAVRISGLPFSTRSAAAERIKSHLLEHGAGVPANQATDVWNARGLSYDIDFRARGPLEFYCSSLIWWGYDRAGAQLNGSDAWYAIVDRLYVTPDDLIESQYGGQWLTGGVPATVVGASSPHGTGTRARTSSAAGAAVHVMLVDDQGRRTGKDVHGTLHGEIPGAWWKSGPQGESVTSPGGGPDWKVVLSGHASGPYAAFARTLRGPPAERGAILGRAQPGVVETFAWSELAEAANGPLAVDDALGVAAGETGTLQPAANDLDPDGDLVADSLALVAPPAHGTAVIAGGGELRYRAAAAYSGRDEIRYRICDARGRCDAATVAVTVSAGGGGRPGGGPPGGGGGPPGGGAPPDTSAPDATLTARRAQRFAGSVAVTVTCRDEACTAAAGGTVTPGRRGRAVALRRASRRLPAGGTATLRLTATGKALRAIRRELRRHARLRVKVSVVVSDAAGNRRTLRRSIRLRR